MERFTLEFVSKVVPFDQYLADYKRGWNIWGLKVFRDHPETKLRPILQVSGDWSECKTEFGTPCGAVTAGRSQDPLPRNAQSHEGGETRGWVVFHRLVRQLQNS